MVLDESSVVVSRVGPGAEYAGNAAFASENGAGGSEQVGMSLYSVDGYVGAYGTAHRAAHVVVDTSGTVEIYFGDIAGKVAKLQYKLVVYIL